MSEPIHIISLGAGVQSSTMALMASLGEITPMPKAAIFADTQAEPASVYRWLDWLEKQLPFPVHRTTAGNLTDETLRVRHIQKDGHMYPKGTGYMNKLIPIFGKSPDGKKTAALGRRCTFDFKIRPLIKKARKIAGIARGQTSIGVIQWIGISMDEAHRMKPPREPWIEHRWPLVDSGITRTKCLSWMRERGYPEPPRSACIYCPFHDNSEWRRLRDGSPDEWEKAISFDKELRRKFREEDETLDMEVYLHSSLLPLDEVDLDMVQVADDQLNFNFGNECEGMCGV